MQKQKIKKTKTIIIPALHTYLIKQFDIICQQFKISLLAGSAQIYGLQIKKNYIQRYALPCNIPIFTWEGCTISVQWKQQQNTKSSDEQWVDLTENNYNGVSPMIRYLQIHYQLTTLRKLALENINNGPKLAIIGGQSAAIQNVCSLMLNYAGKLNMRPLFVDLDIQKNMIFIDGSIGSIVYEYGRIQKLFDRNDKISYFYGNRKIKKQSFLYQAKILANAVNRKLYKDLKNYREKGSSQEYPQFSSGIVVRFPKIKDKVDKKMQKELITDLLKVFQISHTIIIDNSQISAYLNKTPTSTSIQTETIKYPSSKLQGTQSFLQLSRPVKSKIQRYFDPQQDFSKPLTLKISDLTLYELIQTNVYDKSQVFCRRINIQEQSIVKSTIAIMHARNPYPASKFSTSISSMQVQKSNQQQQKQKNHNTKFQQQQNYFDKYKVAKRIQQSTILCLAFIYKVGKGDIILNVSSQYFLDQCKDKIWVSTMSQNDDN